MIVIINENILSYILSELSKKYNNKALDMIKILKSARLVILIIKNKLLLRHWNILEDISDKLAIILTNNKKSIIRSCRIVMCTYEYLKTFGKNKLDEIDYIIVTTPIDNEINKHSKKGIILYIDINTIKINNSSLNHINNWIELGEEEKKYIDILTTCKGII